MNNTKFSVLVSVYRGERHDFFEQCLESIFLNTVLPTEVVIVEDGPLTKELYSVIEKYSVMHSDKIKRLPLENNVGLGNALKIGLEACKYNIVARMDTDDICINNRFQVQLNEFNKDNQLVILGSCIEEFDETPKCITGTRKVPLTHLEILKFAKKRNPFNHMTVMFKKDKVLEVGNYRKVLDIGYEDYDLWIRLLIKGYKGKNLEEPVVKVRTGNAMIKRRGDKKRLKTALYFRKYMKEVGFINNVEYISYCLYTIIFAYSPGIIKKIMYKCILRN